MALIRPIVAGVFPDFEVSLLLYQRQQGKKGEFPILFYLIELEDGEKIVVDTGPCGPDDPGARHHMPVRRTPEMEPRAALANLGVDIDEVKTVILTHLHWDHVSNCRLFRNATFYVQRTELQFAVAPNPVQHGQYEVGIPGHLPPWMEVFPRIRPVDGDVRNFAEGVHLIALPGHTPGSMGVLVDTSAGAHLIPGDHIPLFANWEGDQRLPHIPGSIHIDLDAYFRSFQKVREIADVILPSHDFATLRQACYPATAANP